MQDQIWQDSGFADANLGTTPTAEYWMKTKTKCLNGYEPELGSVPEECSCNGHSLSFPTAEFQASLPNKSVDTIWHTSNGLCQLSQICMQNMTVRIMQKPDENQIFGHVVLLAVPE